MKNRIKVIAVLMLIAVLFAMPASALDITVTVTPTSQKIATNTKDRTQASWLITIFEPQASTYFTEGRDVLGVRIRNTSGSAMTSYFTFDEYVTNRANIYTTVPTQGQTICLHAQSDDSGINIPFTWDGKWFT